MAFDWRPFRSRKFLLSLLALLWYILSASLGWKIPEFVQENIATIVLVYCGSEGAADVVERYANSKGRK